MENTTIPQENLEVKTQKNYTTKLPAMHFYESFKDNTHPIDPKLFLEILVAIAKAELFRIELGFLEGQYSKDDYETYVKNTFEPIPSKDENI